MDVFSKEKRSLIMSRIGGKNTKPELIVRSLLHRMGYRFRLHVADLPGTPDIVLPRHGKVVFVHGCFWHGHKGCKRAKRPATHKSFWNQKIDGNIKHDRKVRQDLRRLGWRVFTVWQCQTRDLDRLHRKLNAFLGE